MDIGVNMFIEVGLHRQGTFVLCLGVQVLFVYVTMWFSCISCTRNTSSGRRAAWDRVVQFSLSWMAPWIFRSVVLWFLKKEKEKSVVLCLMY